MVRAYLLLSWTWIRAAAQYPVSLTLLVAGGTLVTSLDLAAIGVIFVHTPRLGGFTLVEVMFLYGASCTAFALADMLCGSLDKIGEHIKAGTFDTMMVRPVSPLIQLAVDRFSVPNVGRLIQGVAVLVIALAQLSVPWPRLAAVPVMIVCGAVIFIAIYTLGAAFQFVAVDAPEVVNAFTFGGNTLTQYPLTIYGRDVVRVVTFIVPLAFVNWQPGLYVLGRTDPFGLPSWLRFASPVAALLLAGAAALAWRAGLRRYRSTGS